MSGPELKMAGGLNDMSASKFLAAIAVPDRAPDPVAIFHAVRRLPYLSTGDRSAAGTLRRRAGSCSGKHALLTELLGAIGVPAQVELVLGDFATPLLRARGLPSALQEAARGGVRDVHNVVRVRLGDQTVVLDATWHDAVIPFGFRVNHLWSGEGDTVIAVDVMEFLGAPRDPAAEKTRIIGSWPEEEQRHRRAFLEEINTWVAGLS